MGGEPAAARTAIVYTTTLTLYGHNCWENTLKFQRHV